MSKGKEVSGNTFSAILEQYNRKMGNRSNHPAKAPADISQAFQRAQKQMGYSNKPRVKPSKKK
jgi:hypothetical protein